MSQKRLPPPQPEQCLIQSRKAKFKGGTVIAEDVWTREEHRRRLANPCLYRPENCGKCGRRVLHVHDYPERHPRGIFLVAAVRVVRFICAAADCGATWRVLPAWMARHLWWTWKAVEEVTQVPTSARATVVQTMVSPPSVQTERRWLGRLASSARQAVALMGSRGAEVLRGVAQATGLNATRQGLVNAYRDIAWVAPGQRLGAVAAVLDRLERGVRLM
jgi:hypothetical protein